MKRILWLGSCALAGLWAGTGWGQEAVITSLQGNGMLAWTNAVNTNSLYRVEWASSATGPWCRNFDNIGSLDGLSQTGFAVRVPMFYRVVMATNPPPQGMAWIEGGDVVLGQAGFAEPVHTNFISGFWMDEMEVSIDKWTEIRAWAITNGYAFDHVGLGKTNNHPVQSINWYDCVKWCNARSQKEGLTPVYRYISGYVGPNPIYSTYKTGNLDISNSWVNWNTNGYRLPTEAEWEKAARGGRQGRLFPWGGDTIQHARANYFSTNTIAYDTSPTRGYHPTYDVGATPYTSPGGSFPANGYGLHDMAGNVIEWCWDWNGSYSASYQTDPRGPTTPGNRVIRDYSYDMTAPGMRCADRHNFVPADSSIVLGFRCVRGP